HSRLGPKLRGAWSRWQAALWSWRKAGRIWQNLWAARAEQGRRGSLFPRRHPEIDNLEFRSFPGNLLGGAVGATVLGPALAFVNENLLATVEGQAGTTNTSSAAVEGTSLPSSEVPGGLPGGFSFAVSGSATPDGGAVAPATPADAGQPVSVVTDAPFNQDLFAALPPDALVQVFASPAPFHLPDPPRNDDGTASPGGGSGGEGLTAPESRSEPQTPIFPNREGFELGPEYFDATPSTSKAAASSLPTTSTPPAPQTPSASTPDGCASGAANASAGT